MCSISHSSEPRGHAAGQFAAVSIEQRVPPPEREQTGSGPQEEEQRNITVSPPSGKSRIEARAEARDAGPHQEAPYGRGLDDALPISELATAASAPTPLSFEYKGAPLPVNEKERRDVLCGLEAFETRTKPEDRFDDITKLVRIARAFLQSAVLS